MNIRNKKKDIVNISLGHESESYALHQAEESNGIDTLVVYENGFEQGIRFLASYLKEYGITIEMNDGEVVTTPKEDWYSGEVIEKPIDEEKLDELANEYVGDIEWLSGDTISVQEKYRKYGFIAGFHKALEE